VNEYVVLVVGCNADDVSVLALQGGAGKDDALVARGESADGLFAELREPVPAVGVSKRDALGHFVDVGFGVVLIAFNVGKIHGFGNELGDGTLSTSCRAGDEPDVVVVSLGLTCTICRAVRHCSR